MLGKMGGVLGNCLLYFTYALFCVLCVGLIVWVFFFFLVGRVLRSFFHLSVFGCGVGCGVGTYLPSYYVYTVVSVSWVAATILIPGPEGLDWVRLVACVGWTYLIFLSFFLTCLPLSCTSLLCELLLTSGQRIYGTNG